MIAEIELAWDDPKGIQELSDEDYKMPCKGLTQLNLPTERKPNYFPMNILIDMETDGRLLTMLGIEFSVKSFKGQMKVYGQDVVGGPLHQVLIHIPNVGLSFITKVIVLEDCCTEVLQKYLDEGWRILCVCPLNC